MSEYPKVHRVLGKFMELPRDHVNAFVVELENSVLVIDTLLAFSSAMGLRKQAESFGKPIEAVLMTHGHPDHYSGLKAFEDVPRLGSEGCLDFAMNEDKIKAPTAKGYLRGDWPDERAFPNHLIQNGDKFTFGGVDFSFYDLGAGESDSDGIWFFEKDDIKHVFVGDLIANECHCFFRDGHLEEWNKILDYLKNNFDDSTVFYYGHGQTPGGKEIINWQKKYNETFFDSVMGIKDKSLPVNEANQNKVISDMQKYLPNEATIFLLAYELGVTIEELWKKMEAI